MATHPALLVLEVHARTYRRTWRGSVITTFLNPVLFLAAMGLGLGSLVDDSTGSATLEAASYLKFLAPGLLAATAMQTAAGDSSFPVMAGIKWVKNYEAMLARFPDVRFGFLHAGARDVADAIPLAKRYPNVWLGIHGQGVTVLDQLIREVGPERLLAAIGPHIGPCCYEVDAAVLDALAGRHGQAMGHAVRTARAGHAMLDLGALTEQSLRAAGVEADRLIDVCTRCDAERFHSYRRDGPRSGRLVHFVAALDRPGGST